MFATGIQQAGVVPGGSGAAPRGSGDPFYRSHPESEKGGGVPQGPPGDEE